MRFFNLLCAAFAVALVAGCAQTPPAAPAEGVPTEVATSAATADSGSAEAAPADVPTPEAVTAPPPASEPATAALDMNEKVCRRRNVTGSRFPETRCQTRAEWIVEEDEARQTTERLQRTRTTPQM